jgi:hypothetical protein
LGFFAKQEEYDVKKSGVGVTESDAKGLIEKGYATNFEVLRVSGSKNWVIYFVVKPSSMAQERVCVLQAKRGQTREFKRISGVVTWLVQSGVSDAKLCLL